MMPRMLTALVTSFFALTPYAEDNSKPPDVGERAPEIGLEKLLQAPEGAVASWEALKGKVVVLEFWATWCGPCVAAIPHLNQLAAKFEKKPVRFIAITDEDEPTIRRFLKKKPMRGWVGLDTDRSMHRAYYVRGIPVTVVVNPKGIIAAITFPDALTEKALEAVLAGKKPGVTQVSSYAAVYPGMDPQDAAKQPPLFQVLIRPTTKEFGGVVTSRGRMTAHGVSLRKAIGLAWQMRETRVLGPSPLSEEHYTIVVSVPRKKQDQWAMRLRQALQFTFDLTAREETREMDTYVLTAPNGPGPKLTPAASTASGSRGEAGYFSAAGHRIDQITAYFEGILQRPVLDETGLDGRFDFQLKYDADNPESLIEAAKKQLGLKLTLTKRPVEVLVVEKD